MTQKQLIGTIEATVLAAVGSFLASLSAISGGAFDVKHFEAAGIAALIPLGYKLSGIFQTYFNAEEAAPVTVTTTVTPAAKTVVTSPAAAPTPVVTVTPASTTPEAVKVAAGIASNQATQ